MPAPVTPSGAVPLPTRRLPLLPLPSPPTLSLLLQVPPTVQAIAMAHILTYSAKMPSVLPLAGVTIGLQQPR